MDDRVAAETKRIARIARRLTGNPNSVHALRAFILEQQVILEFALNEVLAARVASSYRTATYLAAEVYTRIPFDVRLRMLGELLDEGEGARRDRWPFLMPVLRRIVELRNQLSHG